MPRWTRTHPLALPPLFLIALIVLIALIAAACTDPLETAPDLSDPPQWEDEPIVAAWRGVGTRWSAAEIAGLIDRGAPTVAAERERCRSEQSDDVSDQTPQRLFDVLRPALSPANDDELAWMRPLAQATAQARGLELPPAWDVWIISPADLTQLSCRPLFDTDPTVEPRFAQLYFERLLGIADPDAYRATGAAMIAGLFISGPPGDGGIVLVDDRPLSSAMALAFSHEVVHLLQDQHVTSLDFETTDGEAVRNSDEWSVLFWLIEGDAVDASLTSADASFSEITDAVEWGAEWSVNLELAEAASNQALLSSIVGLASYQDGAQFIESVRADGGSDAVDQLLRDPPASTEQLLHPDKRAADEQPLVLPPLPSHLLPPGDWQLAAADRQGELYLRWLISLATGDHPNATDAAAGWGGDRLELYRLAGASTPALAIWRIIFDDDAEQAEATTAMREWLSAHSNQRALQLRGRPIIGWDGPTSSIRVVNRHGAVWVIAAEHQATAHAAALHAASLGASAAVPLSD